MIVHCQQCLARYDVSGQKSGERVRCRCGQFLIVPTPQTDAGSLRCPECGACVAPHQTQCAFCKAALLVHACPTCFAYNYHRSRHCSTCGAALSIAASSIPKTSAYRCPRCRHQNNRVVLIGCRTVDADLDACPICGGVYVRAAILKRILEKRRALSVETVSGFASRAQRPLIESSSKVLPQMGAPMYIKCPECDTIMDRKNFSKISGVIVDVCVYHGTWFDAGELPKIIEFVQKGGIERSEKRELERERERLEAIRSEIAPMPMMETDRELGWGGTRVIEFFLKWLS